MLNKKKMNHGNKKFHGKLYCLKDFDENQRNKFLIKTILIKPIFLTLLILLLSTLLLPELMSSLMFG